MVSPVIAFDILNGVLIESNQNSEFRIQESGERSCRSCRSSGVAEWMNGKNVCAQFEQRISPSKDYEKLTADSISSLQASFVRPGLLLLNSCNSLLSPKF